MIEIRGSVPIGGTTRGGVSGQVEKGSAAAAPLPGTGRACRESPSRSGSAGAFEPEVTGLEGQGFLRAKLQARPVPTGARPIILGSRAAPGAPPIRAGVRGPGRDPGPVSAGRPRGRGFRPVRSDPPSRGGRWASRSDGARDEVGEAQRLRPETVHHQSSDQAGRGVRRRPDRRRIDRRTARPHGAQGIPAHRPPAKKAVARKPLRERGTDPDKVGRPAGHRDDGQPEGPVKAAQGDHVEPADDDPVEQHGPSVPETAGRLDEPGDRLGRIGPVDPNAGDRHGFDGFGSPNDDRGDRREPVVPSEPTVVHSDEPGMRLGPRALQR